MKDEDGSDFEAYDGLSNKKLLQITKCVESELEIQITDRCDTNEEETRFFILNSEQVKELKIWLDRLL